MPALSPDSIKQLREWNLSKIAELQPQCHWAAQNWMEECFNKGFPFKVSEAFRSQATQDYYWTFGRSRPGDKKTWTKTSLHTSRLAMDCYPQCPTSQRNAQLVEMERIGQYWGVYRPTQTVAVGDLVHFQFDKVRLYVPPTPVDPEARRRALLRRIENTQNQAIKEAAQRQLERLDDRMAKRVS